MAQTRSKMPTTWITAVALVVAAVVVGLVGGFGGSWILAFLAGALVLAVGFVIDSRKARTAPQSR